MKQEELKVIISLSIAFAAAISSGYMTFLRKELNWPNIIRSISFGISITTLFWTFHISYGWKIWPLNMIFYRPNLNGTWAGKLTSDWEDKNGKRVDPITFYIVIRQNFLRIHFTTFTDKFVGAQYSLKFRPVG